MDYLQFGNTKVASVFDANNNYNLSVGYTSGWTISDLPFTWKGFPLTSYTDGLGNFSLAVYLEDGTLNGDTYVYKGNRYGMAVNSSGKRLWTVTSSGSDATATDYTVWRGQKFAINAEKQLLLTQVTLTVEDDNLIAIGGMPVKVVRAGRRWYLSASDQTLYS